MALDKDRLGNGMADAVIALMPASPVSADETSLRTLMKALADEIIKEFEDNGEVNTTVSTPDTFTGTGTGTIT